jgi:hypothetical protein
MDTLTEFYEHYSLNLIGLFGVVVLVYVIIFSVFNNSSLNTPQARPWILLVEVFLWGLFVVIIFLNMKHFKDMDFDIDAFFRKLFGGPELEIHAHRNKDISDVDVECSNKTEVFHIPHNKYTYQKAIEVCESMDARLATYQEVEDSYRNGANWCNYGWSSDQLALFPIQKSMYNELKKIPGHERDCGRPGVNGGYMKNTELTFGANCYGKKPEPSANDLAFMKKYSFSSAHPDSALEKEKRKNHMNKMMVAPFNKDKWFA